jgi:hypothetical protein
VHGQPFEALGRQQALLEASAMAGNVEAMNKLAMLLLSTDPPEAQTAVQWLEHAAALGKTTAMNEGTDVGQPNR